MARTTRTPKKRDWVPLFLEALETQSITHACEIAGVGRRTVYDRRNRDEDFAQAWDDMIERSTETLERALYERALESDTTAAIFLLKARRPHVYRERQSIELTGAGGGPVETRALLGGADPATVDPDKRRRIAEILAGDGDSARPTD